MNQHRKVAAHHHENLKSHARALVHATHGIADSKVSDARAKLNEIIDAVSETVEEAQHMVVEKAKSADEFIKENPYKTAGIALGIGALIGLFLARRHK
jgi:ElaB/YqjD/DUF883 family membrane-anchored ribosome-binding protein